MSTVKFNVVVIGFVGVLAVVSSILYKRRKNKIPNSKWQEVGTVTQLFLYPLKSGRRTETKSFYVDWLGSQIKLKDDYTLRDRCFTVYDEHTYVYQSSQINTKVLQLSTSYDFENAIVRIGVPDASNLALDIGKIVKDNRRIRIGGFGPETVFGIDCGDEAATWISSCLTENEKPYGLRLAFNDTSCLKTPKQTYQPYIKAFPALKNTSFGLYTYMSSILLFSETSLADLNNRIEKPENRVTANHFRPNIVIGGPNLEPYAEDHFTWIKIGEAVFKATIPCGRCLLTTINPENGEKNKDVEPMRTLRKYRQMNKLINTNIQDPVLGLLLDVKQKGTVSVGDKIYIQ